MGNSVRVASRPVMMRHETGKNKKTGFRRRTRTLEVEDWSAESRIICGRKAGSEVLALTNCYTSLRSRSTRLTFLFSGLLATLSPSPETKAAPSCSSTPSSTLVYYTPLPKPERPLQCRICLGPHMVCLFVPEADHDRRKQVQEKCSQARQAERQHWLPQN